MYIAFNLQRSANRSDVSEGRQSSFFIFLTIEAGSARRTIGLIFGGLASGPPLFVI